MSELPRIEARAVSRRYGPVVALSDASVAIRGGEIHALVGENGAGKSTLVRLLCRQEEPDEGSIVTGDVRTAVVPQYPRLAPSIPVWQNLLVGHLPRRTTPPGIGHAFIDRRSALRHLADIADRFGIGIELDKPGHALTGTELRLAAVLAALAHEPDALVLDEPTVGLASPDRRRVLEIVRAVAHDGAAVVFVSHDLREVAAVADRVTALVAGRTVEEWQAPIDAREIATFLFGRVDHAPAESGAAAEPEDGEAGSAARGTHAPAAPGDAGLTFEEALFTSADGTRQAGPLDFIAPAGRITALTGVRESGLDLIERYFKGISELGHGSIRLASRRLPGRLEPGMLERFGVRYVPSGRFDDAAALELSIVDNLIVRARRALHPGGIRRRALQDAFARSLAEAGGVSVTPSAPLSNLSGGMIQKLILARELHDAPRAIVIVEPSSGLDVAAQHSLRRRLRGLADAGHAVLLVSSSADHVAQYADTVAVIYDGHAAGTFAPDDTTGIARAVAGVSDE